MAATDSSKESFTPEDLHLIRLRFMNTCTSKKVLHGVFLKGISKKREGESLFTFYGRRGIKVESFRKNLNSNQVCTIEHDSAGVTFDVTLLFACIQWGNDGISRNHKSDCWKEGKDVLESKLTSIKNSRNNIVHHDFAHDKNQFEEKTKDLQKLLKRTIELAGERYNISPAIIDKEIDDMSQDLKNYRDKPFQPEDQIYYEKEVLFRAYCELVTTKGKTDIHAAYKERCESIVSPLEHMEKKSLPITVFTEMALKRGLDPKNRKEIKFEDILLRKKGQKALVLLVEGIAGVGKTTLAKKILHDWMEGETSVKSLCKYDILLHAEFRDHSISSFTDLLKTLMPTVSKKLKESDLKEATLSHKVLIFLDGLDENNNSSLQLFQEVVDLTRNRDVSLVVTSRPESLELFYSQGIHSVSHIELLGIPREARESFVSKYYKKMKVCNTQGDESKLLDYLRKTKYNLDDIWMLPYNLAQLVSLWVYEQAVVNAVTTSSELYWQFFLLYKAKLKSRLLRPGKTCSPSEFKMKRKTEKFIDGLCTEALKALIADDMNLLEGAYERLDDICNEQGIPTEEMIGAFLQRIASRVIGGFDVKYIFPHKNLQEFLAALYLFKAMQEELKRQESAMPTNSLVQSDSQSQVSNVISRTLKNYGADLADLAKYRNLLVTFTGIMYLKDEPVPDIMKTEILKLLVETGVRSQRDWLRILNLVKCDKFIVSFISQQPGILEGTVAIQDAFLTSYLSLLKPLSCPLQHKLDIEITVEDERNNLKELLSNIERLKLPVRVLSIRKDFEQDCSVQPDYEEELKNIFERCELEEYKGVWRPSFQMPRAMKYLNVFTPDSQSYKSLIENISVRGAKVESLGISMTPNFDVSSVPCIPTLPECQRGPALYIADVEDEDIPKACDISKKLIPQGLLPYKFIAFPRAQVSLDKVEPFMEKLENVKSLYGVRLPKPPRHEEDGCEDDNSRDDDDDDDDDGSSVEDFGEVEDSSPHDIAWMNEEDIWRDENY